MTQAGAFDQVARAYDDLFSRTALGQVMRRAAWAWLDSAFTPGQHLLELNCGTGEDAVHLASRGVAVTATDASPIMLEEVRRKAGRAGVDHLVCTRALDLRRLNGSPIGGGPAGGWDGAFSMFGGLNCVATLEPVASSLAASLRQNATVILCVMGPVVPWEWGWFLVRGNVRKAFRRLKRGGTEWRGLRVHYPNIGQSRRAFSPWFRLRRAGALGALLPPTYAGAWLARHPAWLARLDRWERRLESSPVLVRLADHYLLQLERR